MNSCVDSTKKKRCYGLSKRSSSCIILSVYFLLICNLPLINGFTILSSKTPYYRLKNMVSCPSQNNFHQRDVFHLVSNHFSNEYSSMSKRKHLSRLLFSTIMEEIINNDNNQDTTSGVTLEQKALLQSLDPTIYGSTFLQKLHELMEFKNIYGSCAVPKRYKDNPALGEWVTITPCIFYFISRCSSLTYKRYILFTCFFR